LDAQNIRKDKLLYYYKEQHLKLRVDIP